MHCRCPPSPLHSSKWCWFIPFNGRDYTTVHSRRQYFRPISDYLLSSVWPGQPATDPLHSHRCHLCLQSFASCCHRLVRTISLVRCQYTFSIHIIVLMQSRNLDNETKQLLCRLLHSTMRSRTRERALTRVPCIHCLFILFAVRIRRHTHSHAHRIRNDAWILVADRIVPAANCNRYFCILRGVIFPTDARREILNVNLVLVIIPEKVTTRLRANRCEMPAGELIVRTLARKLPQIVVISCICASRS